MMKSNKITLRIKATAARIIGVAIIAAGIGLLINNMVMTTPFIMGIALLIVGAAIIVLARNNTLKTAADRLTN
jgi:F0F1-type ATP synthase assembly protein I